MERMTLVRALAGGIATALAVLGLALVAEGAALVGVWLAFRVIG